MTGSSFFHRQHSSTAVPNIKSKLATTELRRCWSVDVQSSFESTIDDISEMKFSSTHDPTASDNDSGIEDFDQQPATTVVEPKNNDQTEEMTQFVPTVATDDEEDCIVLAPRKETQSIEEDFTVHTLQPTTTCQLNDEIENFDVNILHRDIERAAAIADEEKKEFCCDTSVVFHGEFARLISCPIELMNPALRYHLIPEYGLDYDPKYFPDCAYVKLDNAKAQFKCQNPDCARLWTTMRARISFKISFPNECGYVYFKIYEQNCQVCGEIAEPLWYMEEVCRVMKNLQEFISQTLVWIPEQYKPLQDNNSPELSVQKRHKPYHSSKQRKGNMKAPHDASLCRACFEGCCFI